MFVSGKLFQPSLMFEGKARSHSRVDHLKGASLYWALAFPAKIGLGWKGLARENALAYYKNWNYGQKSFVRLTPGVKIMKNFTLLRDYKIWHFTKDFITSLIAWLILNSKLVRKNPKLRKNPKTYNLDPWAKSLILDDPLEYLSLVYSIL